MINAVVTGPRVISASVRTGASANPSDYYVGGLFIGREPALNLVAGSNITLAGADNATAHRVDITVSTVVAVASVFGRTGAVTAQAGDYLASQVTNAVDASQSYANPAWISSLAWSKITGAPATGVASVFGRTGAVIAAAGDYSAAQITNAVDSTQVYANPAWISSLAWSKISGAPATGVASVFGRSGTVIAAAGDYTAAQITNAADTTQSYANPAWIASLDWSKISNAPSLGTGSVTSVGLSMPAEFSVAGSPVTTAGTLAVTKASQAANLVYASPSGAAGVPVFRALVAADIPGGVGQNQTPWLQNVNAAGFTLSNCPTVSGNGNITVAAGGAGVTALQTNAITRFSIDSAGHVTINAPDNASAYTLDIGGFSGVNTVRIASASSSGVGSSLRLMEASDGYGFTFRNVSATGLQIIRHNGDNNGVAAMYIDRGTGNVGIGTTTPATEAANARLAVTGAAGQRASSLATSNTQALISFRPDLNSGYTLAAGSDANGLPYLQGVNYNGGAVSANISLQQWGGNVGIGAASPGCLLDLELPSSFSAQTPVLRWGYSNGGLIFGQLTQDPAGYFSGALALYMNGNPSTFISANGKSYLMGGNVGILKNTPAYALDVAGDVNCTGAFRVNGTPITAGGSQTPWTSDINGGNFRLLNAGGIEGATHSVNLYTSGANWVYRAAGFGIVINPNSILAAASGAAGGTATLVTMLSFPSTGVTVANQPLIMALPSGPGGPIESFAPASSGYLYLTSGGQVFVRVLIAGAWKQLSLGTVA